MVILRYMFAPTLIAEFSAWQYQRKTKERRQGVNKVLDEYTPLHFEAERGKLEKGIMEGIMESIMVLAI